MKLKDRDVLNFSFFTINHFVYACMWREGGASREAYFQGGSVKNFDFFCLLMNGVNQERLINKLAKLLKTRSSQGGAS